MNVNFEKDKNLLLSKINQKEIISLTKKLIEIPSVNGNENEIGNFLYDYLKKHGFSVSKEYVENRRPNILVRYKKGKKGKTILLNGHIDTVPAGDSGQWSNDPFSAIEDDCYIHGLGSADMKGGLAAQICTMEAFMESNIPFNGEIIFSGVVDEENTQKGTKDLLNKGILADYSIVSEPSDLQVVTACKGDMDISIHIKGKAAHASVPEKGLNAIYLASKIVLELEKYSNDLKNLTINHQLLGNPTLVVGKIRGGEIPSMVAGSCDLRVDRRLLPNDDIDRVTSEIKKVVDNVSIKYPKFTTETKLLYAVPAMECDIKLPLVRYLQKNINELHKGDSSVHGWSATTDGSLLSLAGIDTVVFGPGKIKVAHKPNEKVEKKQLVLATKIIAATIFDLFKFPD